MLEEEKLAALEETEEENLKDDREDFEREDDEDGLDLLDKLFDSGELDNLDPATLDEEAKVTDMKRQFALAATMSKLDEIVANTDENDPNILTDEMLDNLKRVFYYLSRVLLQRPISLDDLEKVNKVKFMTVCSCIITTWREGILFSLRAIDNSIASGELF